MKTVTGLLPDGSKKPKKGEVMEYEVMEHNPEGPVWIEIPKPNVFTGVKKAKKRCDDLNRTRLGNIQGVNGYYFGVIQTSTGKCIYPL